MIEVEQLSGGYPHFSVERVDLTVERGQFLALIGPNGSGKSTLLKLLTGVLTPWSGTINFNGKPLDRYTSRERARMIGVVGQEEHLAFDFTVEEVVTLGRFPYQRGWLSWLNAEDRRHIEDAMAAAQVEGLRHHSFQTLSGGEKQRVLLARALAQDPQYMFLDEPTNHLDLKHVFDLLNLLKRWQHEKGLTVVAILHDLNVAALYADRLALMKEGQLQMLNSVHRLKDESQLEKVYGVEVNAQAHPHLDRPQFMLTPHQSLTNPTDNLWEAYRLIQKKDWFQISFPFPLKAISNSTWGGGLQWANHFAHLYLPKLSTYEHAEIKTGLLKEGLPPEQTVVFLSQEPLTNIEPVMIKQQCGDDQLLVIALANASSAAATVMVFIDSHLSDNAFVHALITAGQARQKALTVHERDGVDVEGSVLIAATQKGMTPPISTDQKRGQRLMQILNQVIDEAVQQTLHQTNRPYFSSFSR